MAITRKDFNAKRMRYNSIRNSITMAHAKNQHKAWSDRDIKALMEDNAASDKELAFRLGRSERAVQLKRLHLRKKGINVPSRAQKNNRYTEDDKKLLAGPKTLKWLANHFGVSVSAVANMRYKLRHGLID